MSPRDALVLVMGCVLAVLLLPQLPVVGVPLAALTLAWITYQGRVWTAVALAGALTAAVALVTQQPLVVVSVGPMLVLCGPLAARALESRKAGHVVWALGGAIAAVSVGAWVVELVVRNMSPAAYYAEAVRLWTSLLDATLQLRGEEAEQVQQLARTILEILPASVAVTALLTALLSVVAVTIAARWTGRTTNRLPRLAVVDMSVHVVWPAIIGLLLSAVAAWLHADGSWFGIAGRNLLFLGRALLLVQGLAVYAGLYERAQFSPFVRGLGYTLLVVIDAMLPIVSLTGLADLWVNIRRLPREAGAAAEGT